MLVIGASYVGCGFQILDKLLHFKFSDMTAAPSSNFALVDLSKDWGKGGHNV